MSPGRRQEQQKSMWLSYDQLPQSQGQSFTSCCNSSCMRKNLTASPKSCALRFMPHDCHFGMAQLIRAGTMALCSPFGKSIFLQRAVIPMGAWGMLAPLVAWYSCWAGCCSPGRDWRAVGGQDPGGNGKFRCRPGRKEAGKAVSSGFSISVKKPH